MAKPHDHDDVQPTEAVAFDPFADDEPGTEAVAFDPFADDDDLDDDSDAEYAGLGEMAGLLKDLDKLRKGSGREDTSQRSRQAALDTFRERRGTRRASRIIADGMVELPWVEPTEPREALIDPEPAVVKKGIAPPVLHPGDIVAGQYEITGVIAHGGMGWIYLAQDHYVAGRVVVLKGLHSTDNPDEAAAAEAEREFLADITHPGIVKIFNFIDDPRVPGGFTVMEYVGGPSLRARRNSSPSGVLEPDIAIAYILEVLPALDYLHSRGVVYNDLKPDNIIVTEDQVKLIDMGAVSGIGAYGFIYGTKGFQAPEVATEGPSIASDIYTVGRTLASLVVDLPQTDGIYDPGLPTPTDEPLFRQYTSLYRLLARCCNENPARRFDSVSELESQLLGVLREVVAVRDGRTYPAQHSLFSPQRRTFGTKHLVFRTDQLIDGISRTVDITPQEVVAALPSPLINRDDVGAAMLQGSSYAEPRETLETLRQAMTTPQYEHSVEIPFGVVRTMIDLGLTSQARSWLLTLQDRFGDTWRFSWYSGVVEMLLGDFPTATRSFSEVLNQLPGEAAPKLALAAVSELLLQERGLQEQSLIDDSLARTATNLEHPLSNVPTTVLRAMVENGQMDPTWTVTALEPGALRFHAIRLYSLVWLTNPTTVSSAFGLARMLMREGETDLALRALDKVPNASRHSRMAQLTAILYLVLPVAGTGADPTEAQIREAAARLDQIPTTEPRFLQIKTAVLDAALHYLVTEGSANTPTLFEYSFTEREIRHGLAQTLRAQARVAPYAQHRYALVDMANKVRPATWF
ncbi:serine/threonine protein kinase [Corynebacterium coyleae]|uniref:serine/threonine protein kinase n=1 Tax=Corynebacterium coyleae TaxID=53374 RepID=UPI00254F7DA3|nr:serine/threonine protein kinase [Corynebacterium coyleae]MDK8664362.1 tetratricopeptide repeat protein [Corynebacterium coyleae]MDK8707636.1 tetratricopeptide repeat protein [Corynebacterium coyleae]MDK8734456.1 tetratricopeptide repeat protein [Corynebacterium coyleae]MDK8893443.1 tetratricopeptide repeat protein [Corynebacterium coyleae]